MSAQDVRLKRWLGNASWSVAINDAQEENWSRRIVDRRRKPLLVDGIVIRIEAVKFRRCRVSERMVVEVGVKESAVVVLCDLILMDVQKRRFQEGERQGEVHQDGSPTPHTDIVPHDRKECNLHNISSCPRVRVLRNYAEFGRDYAPKQNWEM